MNEKENDIIYTAQDIEKYLSGKLTSLQMHAMEKAALDDEFLADAMEGYSSVNEEERKKQLAGLKTAFENNGGAAKVIAMPARKKNNWWKVAAAILFIGTAATFSYLALNKKEPVQIAQEVPNTKTETPAAVTNTKIKDSGTTADLTAISDKEDISNSANGNLNTSTEKSAEAVSKYEAKADDIAVTESMRSRADSSFVYKPAKEVAPSFEKKYEADQKRAEEIANLDQKATVQSNNAAPATVFNTNVSPDVRRMANTRQAENGIVAASADKNGYLKKQQNQQQYDRFFSAQVLAPDNTPLPFANISIKNENFGTYADVKGNFRLVSTDSVITVEVKAAGYQPQFYTLQSYLAHNKIILKEEDVSARYKTITANPATAKSKTSRKATLLKDSVVNVEPADGWENYNTYVNNNIEIPDDILDKNLHGQVQLSFDIKPNGTITNIKVDKSLCDNCDEAAKRLLEQGPQWKTKNGKKGKGKVVVQF